jgi:hypothetical protein
MSERATYTNQESEINDYISILEKLSRGDIKMVTVGKNFKTLEILLNLTKVGEVMLAAEACLAHNGYTIDEPKLITEKFVLKNARLFIENIKLSRMKKKEEPKNTYQGGSLRKTKKIKGYK